MKSYVLGVIVILIIVGFFIINNSNNFNGNIVSTSSSLGEGITPGKLAKDFSLITIESKTVKLSDFRGKYVLFAFFATWCTPCKIEAQNVKKAQENLDLPLVVMQIGVDPRETKQDLINFRNQFGKYDWIMGFDDGSISSLYNIRTFDTTLVVDPEGKIIYRDDGFPIDTKTLEDLIVKGESVSLELGSIHKHANISVILGEKKVDFSEDKYQLRSSFVHFEDKNGKEVHVHAKGVTLKYLFETLGWEAGNCLKTDFGKYCNASIKVNGKVSDINHEIRDGETIEVVYQ